MQLIDAATATVVLTAVLFDEHVQLAALLDRSVLALRLAEVQASNFLSLRGWVLLLLLSDNWSQLLLGSNQGRGVMVSVSLTLRHLDVLVRFIDVASLGAHLRHITLGKGVLKLVGLIDVVGQVFLQLRGLAL